MSTRSLWQQTAPEASYPRLTEDVDADVVVIGAGITGLTTALLLKRRGRRVCVLERGTLGSGATGFSTAHLTAALDIDFRALVRKFGVETARSVIDANMYAIGLMEDWVRELEIDCDFVRVAGYRYTESGSQVPRLEEERRAAEQLGLATELVPEVPLPFAARAAIRIANQAQLHPIKYLQALAAHVHGDGSIVACDTPVDKIEDGMPCAVRVGPRLVRATHVVRATHTPIGLALSQQTRLRPETTYVIACRVKEPIVGLFWDTEHPYHYIRAHGDFVLIGGMDHKTGQERDPARHFRDLEAWTRERFSVQSVEHRWSNEVFESADGLPYIGRLPGTRHDYVASGFAGNGMTFGTAAGVILSDLISEQPSAWADAFLPSRIGPITSSGDAIALNLNVAWRWIADRVRGHLTRSLDRVLPGTGEIARLDGRHAAVYRDLDQNLHILEATCSHAGCIVQWNQAEHTWDCPCHGGRYDATGTVLCGPPTKDLQGFTLKKATPAAHPPIGTAPPERVEPRK